jgi:hypothetical protein
MAWFGPGGDRVRLRYLEPRVARLVRLESGVREGVAAGTDPTGKGQLAACVGDERRSSPALGETNDD